ncbi:MAG: TIGR04282 family arsenosugar biosynthesis glycosyltransferase [Hyphomicrobiaceae bacterium]
MAKQPRAGRVKSRLARTVGVVAATGFYRAASRAVIQRLSCTRRWQTVLAVTPDNTVHDRAWPGQLPRIAQGGGDLGTRMQHAIDAMPPGPVVVIGTDIPAIRPNHVAEAFSALGDNDAVFGPAPDGGYWLVGLSTGARSSRPFDNVRWSGPFALEDTLNNLQAKRVGLVSRLSDIDSGDDLAAEGGLHGRIVRQV